jgi:hypothetical protein
LETHKGYLSGCSLKPRDIYWHRWHSVCLTATKIDH